MANFTILRKQNGEYSFYLKADNGEIILTSEGFLSKVSCRNAINTVKENAPFDNFYDRRTTSHGKYYFVLKSSNGENIGHSEQYESQAGREYGITAVKRYAPIALIENNA